MKHIILISLVTFVTSCGNPHVSSVRDNIDRTVSPLTEAECDEALSEARVFTSQEQYKTVAGCQEQEQEQNQEQNVEETSSALVWNFAEPVTHFGTKIPAVMDKASVEAYDCNGSLMVKKEITSDTDYLGVTGPAPHLCSLTLTYEY